MEKWTDLIFFLFLAGEYIYKGEMKKRSSISDVVVVGGGWGVNHTRKKNPHGIGEIPPVDGGRSRVSSDKNKSTKSR